MKQIVTNVYSFDELSDKAKEKARQWFREVLDSDDHWKEFVYEDAKAIAQRMGLKIDKIYWSGFSSQGDGACFEGSFNASHVEKGQAKEYAPQDKEIERISLYFTVKHNGHYYHKYETVFNVDIEDVKEGEVEMPSEDFARLEKKLIEIARDFMDWIYRQLQKEYEYQNSDECVDENIKANEYTFTSDGKRFGD